MDGFAVIAAYTKGATQKNPATLQLAGTIAAGDSSQCTVSGGTAVAVATGARFPSGADAVVMVEYTESDGKFVKVFTEVPKGKHVSPVGEDLKKGKILLKKGTWLRAQDVSLVASVGVSTVKVFCKPKVAVFSTGSELVEVGTDLSAGAVIFDSNRYMLSALISELGGEAIDLGICMDDEAHIKTALEKALQYNMAVMSGGSSVGEKDYAPKVINSMGKPGVLVHGVAMRPGSPTGLSLIDDKPVLNCPGYPVAAYFAFFTFGKPLLYKMLQTSGIPEAKVAAKLTADVKLNESTRNFVRVKIITEKNQNGNIVYLAEPVSAAAASLLSTLTDSDAVIIAENQTQLKQNQTVEVHLLRPTSGGAYQ